VREELKQACASAAKLLATSRRAVAFTGAGVSVASGIPDFRSPGGLWTRYDPAEVASLGALRSNPAKVWEFLVEAHAIFSAARPNPAHEALAAMEAAGLIAGVVTQNIDGLHQAAGSAVVIEYHGTLARLHCMRCGAGFAPGEAARMAEAALPPTCPCGGVIGLCTQ